MKRLKIASLLVLAVTALLAFAGNAPAEAPPSPSETTYEGNFHAFSEGHATIDNPIAKIECAWTLDGEASGEPVEIMLSSMTIQGCTNGWHVTVVSAGTLKIDPTEGSSGTLTWSGATIEATRAGVTCRYATGATDIGTLTGGEVAEGTIDLSAALPFHSGSGLCGSGATSLTGALTIGTTDHLEGTPTSPAGTTYEGNLHASSEGHVVIHNPIAKIECASTLEGKVEERGGGEPIGIPLTSLTFSCTNSWHVTVVSAGTLEIDPIAGTRNGTLTSTGMTIEGTRFGITCRYRTEATDLGTLTGSKTTGGTATIDLSGALPEHSGSSGLCGAASDPLTGSFSVGTPDYLDVDGELGDTPTSPAGTTYEGNLHASSEGHVVIHNPIAKIECASTLEGKVEERGGGEPIGIPLTSLTFSCTNSWHVTVVSAGTLEIDPIAGTRNGTLTSTGMTIEGTRFGITCRYRTEATDLGTLTGSKTTGGTATIDLSGALPEHSGSSGLCGAASDPLTGSFSVGTPDYLDVDGELGDTPTSPAGTTYEGNLHASSEGHVVIHNPIAKIECASTLEGKVEERGGGEPIGIPLTSLTFSCTNSWHVTVVSAGTLEIDPIAGTRNGTLTSTGMTIEGTRFGITCRYRTEATDLGTLTGSKTTGGTATIDLSGALPEHSGSSGLCGAASDPLTGSFSVGTPDYLDVDGES